MPELVLFGGVAIVIGFLLLLYVFVNTDPAKLARALRWTGLGVAGLLLLFVLLSERFAFIWTPLIFAFPHLRGYVRSFLARRQMAGATPASEVVTPYLRVSLDHETGAMTGTVLAGSLVGMRLEELTVRDLLSLLRECRAADQEGARLLEAYLERIHPGWRDEFAGSQTGAARQGAAEMSPEEAHEILGLAPGADEAAIKAAYHRLMMQMHPDHGGSDYLAAKINRARDMLLRRR